MTGFTEVNDIPDARGEQAVVRRTVYIYESPVRIWHWLNALCMVTLFVTGYLIATPMDSVTGEAVDHFRMGYVRFFHFAAGQTMAVIFLMRIGWAAVGNSYSRQIFYIPFWKADFWMGVIRMLRWYLFLDRHPAQYMGHNPLAWLMMFFLFTIMASFQIITGFALYSEGAGRDSWQYKVFGWVFSIFPNSQDLHTWHHMGMWVLVCFVILHIYAAVREDILSRQSTISSMISGERIFRDDRH